MVVKTGFFDPNEFVRGKMPIINGLIVPQFADLGKSRWHGGGSWRVFGCDPNVTMEESSGLWFTHGVRPVR